MDESEQNTHHFGTVLKELSDIKASLAVNTNETANIKSNISEIKGDIKEIKSEFITRREFNGGLQEVRNEIAPLRKFIYGLIALVLTTVGLAVLGLVLIR